MKKVDLAVVGATGVVGEAVVELLEKRDFPLNNLHLLASDRTAGTSLMFKGKPVMVKALDSFDFSDVDMAIFVATDEVSMESLPLAQSKGCLTIDNSQAFCESAPIVVPSVNGELLSARPSVVVNPDSSAIQLATVLKPFYDQVGIERANLVVCQSVSGLGKKAINELATQTASLLNGRGAESQFFPQQIAFNLLPFVGEIGMDGHSNVEKRVLTQTRRLMGDENLDLNVTSVQVPVFYADSMALTFDTISPMTLGEVMDVLDNSKEIKVLNDTDEKQSVTPVTHVTGEESIFVSRIRRDMSHERGINLLVMADNVKKCAAINSIQIAEELIKSYL